MADPDRAQDAVPTSIPDVRLALVPGALWLVSALWGISLGYNGRTLKPCLEACSNNGG